MMFMMMYSVFSYFKYPFWTNHHYWKKVTWLDARELILFGGARALYY